MPNSSLKVDYSVIVDVYRRKGSDGCEIQQQYISPWMWFRSTLYVIPLLLKHIDISPKSITVIDMKDESESIADAIKIGVNFRVDKLLKII